MFFLLLFLLSLGFCFIFHISILVSIFILIPSGTKSIKSYFKVLLRTVAHSLTTKYEKTKQKTNLYHISRYTHPTSDVITDFSFFFFFFPTSLFSVTFWETTLSSWVLAFVFFKVLSSSCAICCWYSCSSLSSVSSTWLSDLASAAPLLFPFLLFRFGSFPPPTSSASKAISDLEASASFWV